ncbi:MAG: hypothetical protein HN566_05720 [Polaribacter sp.]|jgi:hypothetical protein|nr:hypothetical protein [Polaribacter sp.]
MSNIYTKKQNEKFDDFIYEMNDSNPFTYNGLKDKRPNKFSIDVYWTHDKKGNLVLYEEYMLHLFRRQMMYYKKTYVEEKEVV